MSQTSTNPYSPPAAIVSDAQDSGANGTLIPGGRNVPAGRGAAWFGEGWNIFKAGAGTWIGMIIVFFVIIFIVNLIPFFNLLNVILGPVFMGGFAVACERARNSDETNFADLFAGFERKFGQLALVGLINFGLMLIGIIPALLLMGFSALPMLLSGKMNPQVFAAASGGLFLGFGIFFIWNILVSTAIAFAPAQVVLHDLPAFEAMKSSLMGSLRNIPALILAFIIFFVLAIFATIPIGLGWLVLVPVLIGTNYSAYRDIFTE